ncbi:MAG: hypothetical protein PHU44_05025 [Syntrophales bacterium]|nr:hypothetical protein [Syntrophales bacterium]MDD5641462.1 hypothetical protein [Syntrophales bacterium]
MAAELTVGTRIYRPASLAGRGEERRLVLDNPAMAQFDDGTVMLRAVPGGDGASHWRVIPWKAGGGRVLVCDEPIPEDWTYFEVLFADVNFVAVSPVAGELEELTKIYQQ